jgi:hypothetical protein
MRDATHSNIQPPSSVQTDASKCKQSTMQTLPITHNLIGELPSVGQVTPIASAIDCESNGNATNTHIAMTIGIERNARLNTSAPKTEPKLQAENRQKSSSWADDCDEANFTRSSDLPSLQHERCPQPTCTTNICDALGSTSKETHTRE